MVAIGAPETTASPLPTMILSTNEYDVRKPPPWEMVTDDMPATRPAKVTVPAPAARTTDPGRAAKSTPQ